MATTGLYSRYFVAGAVSEAGKVDPRASGTAGTPAVTVPLRLVALTVLAGLVSAQKAVVGGVPAAALADRLGVLEAVLA